MYNAWSRGPNPLRYNHFTLVLETIFTGKRDAFKKEALQIIEKLPPQRGRRRFDHLDHVLHEFRSSSL